MINFVVCECLQAFVLVAFELQICVRYYDALPGYKMNERSWNEVIWQLYLKYLYVLANKEQSAVDTLYANGGFARANPNREVEAVAFKLVHVNFFVNAVAILVDNSRNYYSARV